MGLRLNGVYDRAAMLASQFGFYPHYNLLVIRIINPRRAHVPEHITALCA